MKPKILSAARRSLPLASIICLAFTAPAGMAQTNGTWDGGGTSAIWGGVNNWNPNGTIANGAGATATFGTGFGSGTNIQVNTNRTIGNINHNSTTTDITISQINSSIFTLDVTTGSPTVTVGTAARTLTITAPISGNDGLTKAGAGTCVLSGLNLFTGNVTVNAGTLVAGISGTGGNSAFGSSLSTKTLNVNSGTTLRFDVGNVFNNNFASDSTSLPVLNLTGGTLTNGGTATNSALGDITLAGGTLTATLGSASGYGSWNLNGTVTSTGSSTISTSAAVPITLSAAAGTTTTFDVQSGTLTASAALGEVTAAGDERVSGLTKIGAGTLLLSGINTYTGNTAINQGALSIATKEALPGYNVNGRYSVASGATLAVGNGVLDSEITEILGTGNFVSGANLGFDTTAGSRTVALNLADTANGPLGIVKLGANTLTLSGTNTHTGGTYVLAGALNLPSTSTLPGWNVNGGFSVASGASLIIPNSVSESEVTTMLGTTNIAAGASLLFDTSAGDRTYVSALTDSASGLLNIGKIGTNTLTLAGASTFTGSTNVTSGTLRVTGSITGLPGSSKININPASGSAIFNYNGGSSTLFAITGSTVADTASVFNMSGGTLTISPGIATGTQSVTGAGNGAGTGAYGYYNITGGTFRNTNRFTVTGQASASATNGTGAGVQTGVVYVGGTGFIDQTNGEWWLNYSLGQVTVAESGKIDRTGSSSPFGIFMNHAANVTGGGYGVLNLAGTDAEVILGTGPIRFGNSTTSTQGSGQSGFVNVAAGTLSVGANANASLPAAPVSINNAYFNFAGGTVLASANLSGWIPLSNASINYNSNIFGPVDNPGTAQDFTGGLTLDSGGFNVTIANPLQAPGGVGVTQADLSVSGGSGYVGAPAVIFSSADVVAGGTPAAGYATISGGAVTGIVITSPGTYLNGTTPTVTLIGGGGTGASVTSGALTTANVSGGLTKTGAGVLTLSGANTYTGATAVNAGTLNLTGSLASNVTVANNAGINGEGSTTGSLVFSGTSELGFDPVTTGSLTAASANATGATVSILPTTAPTAATGIVVLNAPGGITGTIGSEFVYTGRGTLTYNVGNTQLLLDTAPPASLAWRGNDGTNPTLWDLNSTANWDSGGAEKFFNGDGVTFDDTAASFVVDINAGKVLPGSITFNNTANNYTIQGAFGIYGGTTLTKNGTGTTIINNSNGYTGSTTVNAGVLNIRNAMALGDIIAGTTVTAGAALEIQGGIAVGAESLSIDGSGILNNGALRSISGDNSWGTAVALAGAGTIGVDTGTLTLPSLTGAFGLTKVGAGTLNITGTTAVTSTTVEAGTLYMGAQSGASTTTTLGASNPVTLNGSSNLTIRRTNTGVSNLLGAISGTGSLTLLGDNANTRAASDFALNDASDFSGGTTVIGARANITTTGSALGTGPVTLGTNGQFFVQTAGLTLANDLSIGGIGWDEASGFLGAIRLNSTTLTGNIALTSNARITTAGTSELSGIISGGFDIDFFEDTAIGTITLSGNNDYTGETIINSMGEAPATLPNLIVAHNNALGTNAGGTTVYGTGSTSFGSQLTLADGITVTGETLTLDTTATAGYRASLIAVGTATWDGNVITAGSAGGIQFFANGAGLTIGSSDTDTITGTNSLLLRGTGTGTINSTLSIGTLGFFKTDAGTWTITSNNNDFTGTPAIASGILSVGSIANAGVNSALGAGTSISLGQNSATSGTGTLQFTGATGGSSNRALLLNNGTSGGEAVIENTVAGQTLALSGALTVNTPASASALTLAGAGNGLLSGGIADTPLMALNKTGAGTWTLTGANTYTGTTTIDQGTLAFATTNQSLAGGLVFGATVGSTNVGALDLTAASATFGGGLVVQTNSASNNVVNIGSGQTLTFSGSTLTNAVTVGTNTDGGVANLQVSGSGTLTIDESARNLVVANTATTAVNGAASALMDLSGLSSFNATVANVYVGRPTFAGGAVASGRPADSLILAGTNALTVSGNLVVGAQGAVGHQAGNFLRLGSANTIHAADIVVGNGRANGNVSFNSGLTNPSVTLRGAAGGTSRTNITLGDQVNSSGVGNGGGGSNATTGTMNFTGGTVDALIGTLRLGVGAVAASNNRGAGIGVFTFGPGSSVDIDTLVVGQANNNSTTSSNESPANSSTGNFNMNGGTLLLNTAITIANDADTSNTTNGIQNVTGNFNQTDGTATIGSLSTPVNVLMGNHQTAGNSGLATANMNLTGGTTNVFGNIQEGNLGAGTITSTLTLNGGTLDMKGNPIGVIGSTIDNLNFESGTLSNVASINGTGGLTKTTAGTLLLSGTISYVGDTTVSEGTLTLSSAASPANANSANDASTVTIASSGATLNLTYTGTDNVDKLFIGAGQMAAGVYGHSNSGATNGGLGVGAMDAYFGPGTGTLTVASGTNYASWINGFFPGETDPAIIGVDADPDNDTIPNGVEIVIGGDPKNGMDTALLPTLELVTDPVSIPAIPAGNYLLFTYRRTDLSVSAGVTADCETDTDLLAPWTPATGAPGVVIQVDNNFTFSPPAAADTDRVRVYVPRGANTALFGRLNVSVP